ncbi:hypothetical protein Pme01_17410 [Planosporangium mesophilum]|uniref:Uncharacterized protein n=1 Tax=Planosporangium mesophilum TaxID=689768 RepID=A0A8J3X0A3_9ACTN|nr:hypothetical protein Pme01_17410 [Planosporangium mesophilum]
MALDLVQGADLGVHLDEPVAEVGVGAGQAGEFAPAHAGVGGGEVVLQMSAFESLWGGLSRGMPQGTVVPPRLASLIHPTRDQKVRGSNPLGRAA